MKRIAIAAAAALLMLGSAQAQQARPAVPGWYGEVGYGFLNISEPGVDVNPQLLRGVLGYNVHPFFALEGMLGFGTASDDFDTGAGFRADAKVENTWGLFVKPKYDFGNVEVFGRLGWARTKLKVDTPLGTGRDSDNDFAYGVGLNYSFNPRTYVGVDYMRYFDKNNTTIDGWSINVGYRF
jgi:outer membrane autotransporter protein